MKTKSNFVYYVNKYNCFYYAAKICYMYLADLNNSDKRNKQR